MNPNTRVSVHGYSGDMQQVVGAMPIYLHHECPLTVLSPEDAKIEIPDVDCRFAGKRAYTGQDSLDRQWLQMKMLLEYPEEHFLIHDSDSVCLIPEIPQYLYQEDVLWSNLVNDNMPGRERGYYMNGFPRLAFQPPYFMSRRVLERLMAPLADANLPMNPTLPFIDHYMVQIAVHARVPWKNFKDGITGPISSDKHSFEQAWRAVQRKGVVMVHSVKSPDFWRPLMDARSQYVAGGGSAHPPPCPPLMRWSQEQSRTRGQQMDAERQIANKRGGVPTFNSQRVTVQRNQSPRGKGVRA